MTGDLERWQRDRERDRPQVIFGPDGMTPWRFSGLVDFEWNWHLPLPEAPETSAFTHRAYGYQDGTLGIIE